MEVSADLSKHKYAIAIPCYDGNIKTETAMSLLSTSAAMINNGIQHTFVVIKGGALIDAVRNELTHRFLHMTDCDTVICIDADLEWDWDSFLRLLVFSDKYPIVAGCYPCRTEPVKFIINHTSNKLTEDGLVETNGLGMGFVAIKREVFENLDVREFDHKDYPTPVKEYFRTDVQNRQNIGEDVYFFRKAWDAGYKTMVDPGIELIHHGHKAFNYQFKDYVHQILGE